MNRKQEPYDPCAGEASSAECERPPLERLRYWDGRFLVARDLEHQQADLIRRIEYHQAYAHGAGVLCGFQVKPHPREGCSDRWIVVTPGMAYDCCGHTLWLPEPQLVELPPRPEQKEGDAPQAPPPPPPPPPVEGSPKALPEQERTHVQSVEVQRDDDLIAQWKEHERGQRQRVESPPPPPRCEWEAFLVARRVECPTDALPALYADDLCEPVRQQYGRVREQVELKLLSPEQISDECWPRPRPLAPEDCSAEVDDDCELPLGDVPPCSLDCACGEYVVLARLCRDARTGELHVDTTQRKVLAADRGLTRITGVSWPHGGEVPLEHLLKRRELVVRFSRPLQPAQGIARGINRMTFQVSYLGQSGNWEEILSPDPGDPGIMHPSPRLSHNRRCAIFDLPHAALTPPLSIAGSIVRVRLLCDFLLDCHGRAVSGAHLGGWVNERGSGDGHQGGVFESWFYVGPWRGDKV